MESIKLCTDHKQSEKLKEILSLETADMSYDWLVIGKKYSYIPQCRKYIDDELPSWSLTALLRLMPFHIIENNNRFGFYQVKGFNKQGETYRFGYKTNKDYFLFETSWYNDVIDAAFEMVCWLKENNKI